MNKVCVLTERLPTPGTRVRLLASVGPLVLGEMRLTAEGMPTLVTPVRSLPSVDSLMLSKK